MAEIIKIKKYGNRRYYSSLEKGYITVDEISKYVVKGLKIQVVDEAESDITAEVLTQILLEKGRAQHFPIELLESMIRMNEKTLSAVWAPLIEQNLKLMTQMSEFAMTNMKALVSPFSQKDSAQSRGRSTKK